MEARRAAAAREAARRRTGWSDDRQFLLKQIATGADEGLALVAEHDDVPVALLLAQVEPAYRTVRVHDLRVDYDQRRQGLATAMMFQVIADRPRAGAAGGDRRDARPTTSRPPGFC